MKSSYFKLVIVFIVIFFVSNALMLISLNVYNETNAFSSIEQSLLNQVGKIRGQLENGTTTVEAAASLLDTTQFSLSYYTDDSQISGSDYYSPDFIQDMKQSDQIIVQSPRSILESRELNAGFRYNGGYIVVGLEYNKVINRRVLAMQSGLFSLLIGSIIIMIAGRRMVRPVHEMSEAAVKISHGIFDVQIRHKGKDEMGKLAQTFNMMAKELAGMEMMRSDFISSVSHEFKTPLATIEGYVRLLKPADEEQKDYIEIILSETDRLSNMSRNILILSQLENQSKAIETTQYRLDEQLRHAVLLQEGEWSKKNLEFNMELPKTVISANEPLMFQALSNILNNAIKFADEGSAIDMNIENTGSRMLIRIRNQGPILSEEAMRHIFDKFYQADSSRSMPGNGLGLAIVRKIVSLHNGEVTVKSEQGFGTEFCIALPQS